MSKAVNINQNSRLLNMYKENKITEEEYQLLINTLEKKSSFAHLVFSTIVNPFQKVAGIQALIIGLTIMVCMSYLGSIAKIYFDGSFGSSIASSFNDLKVHPTFFILLYQCLVSWVVLSVFYIALAKLFRQKRIRIIDFFGTVALSRYPYLILTSIMVLISILNPAYFNIDVTHGYHYQQPSFTDVILDYTWNVCFIWQIATYFFALKESSGLTSTKLWLAFIVTISVGEPISIMLSRIFF